MPTVSPRPVVRLNASALEPGYLGEIFRSGCKAVILLDDPRVSRLRNELISRTGDLRQSPRGEILPWESNLTDIANNHLSEGLHSAGSGDVLAYVPGQIGYTARKISLKKEARTGEIRTVPKEFYSNGHVYKLPDELVQIAWELMSDVMNSVFPKGAAPNDYEVSINRLKYDDTIQDLHNKIALIRGIGGGWSRRGHNIDANRAEMVGPFNVKYIGSLLALASLIPRVHQVVQKLNGVFSRFDDSKAVPPKTVLIGGPHFDNRFITCLCNTRLNIRTEFHDGFSWKELPVTSGALTILPQTLLRRSCNINPTWHRVLHTKREHVSTQLGNISNRNASNISLVFAAFKLK